MKTIALNEQTYQLLQHLKMQQKLASYDALLRKLMQERESMPDSLFGSLKGKTRSFTAHERKRLWKDTER